MPPPSPPPSDATRSFHCQCRVPCAPRHTSSVRLASPDHPELFLLWRCSRGLESHSILRHQLLSPCCCCSVIYRHWPVHGAGDAAGRLSMAYIAGARVAVHPVLRPRAHHYSHCGADQVQGIRRPCSTTSWRSSRRGPRHKLGAQHRRRSHLREAT